MSACQHCRKAPIPKGHRRYCRGCSPLAVKIWKSRNRRLWAEAWRREGCQGPAPYLDGWESREAYRAYYRAYMRAWRRRKRERAAETCASTPRRAA